MLTTLQSVDVFPVRLPMKAEFKFASGRAAGADGKAPHVFVKVTASNGAVGWGEGRPVPSWSYETLETVTHVLRHYLVPAVLGHDLWDRAGLHQKMHAVIGRGPSTGHPVAKAALDIAVHDVCARLAGVPLRRFLGGGEFRTTDLSYTVTAHSPEAVRDQVAQARDQGFRHFNFKAGFGFRTDVNVAKAVRACMPDEGFLWADANQGLTLPEAKRLAEAFLPEGVGVLEQPLPADQLSAMRALRKSARLPLALDESTVSPADFFQVAAEGLVDYLVVKITRSGGLFPSLQQIAVAQSAGIPLLLSGLTDGFTVKQAACQLTNAFGFSGPAALNGSQFVDESALFPDKDRMESRGRLTLGDEPGVGLHPDERALRELATRADG